VVKKTGFQKHKKSFAPSKKNKILAKKLKTLNLTKVEKKRVTGVKTPS
jgi:hypothetical protein